MRHPLRSRSLTCLLAASACVLAGIARGDDGDGDYPKTVEPPMLGVYIGLIPDEVLQREGLGANEGVYVASTISGSAAEHMGVRAGDVLLSYNGDPLATMGQLRTDVESSAVGSEAQVSVRRNGQTLTLSAPLEKWPESMGKMPIPGAWERAMRDEQAKRLDRDRQKLDALQAQVAALDERYPAHTADDDQRIAQLERRLLSGADSPSPWVLTFTSAPRASDEPAASDLPVPIEVAGSEAGVPWRLSWSSEPRP
ncbi:MAG: PDZ domain-containing protein [Planctomycetes bacterium]|nr:PDZ domain-containing protein [Planctomycetota bacterium]